MKLRTFLGIALFTTTLASCFSDETTLGNQPISEIIIDSTSIEKVYNIDKNETLVISPAVSQTNGDKELAYTWEINLETYSNDREFVYVGK